jgi:O-antigen/teichoic acid export membrane protein
MVGIAALGLMRLIHGSLVSRATDHRTYALVGTLIGVSMTVGLFLPGGLSSAASKFIPYQRARGSAAGAQIVYRALRRVGYAWALVTGAGTTLITATLLHIAPDVAVSAGLLVAGFSLYSVEKAALYGFDRVSAYARLELLGSGLAVATTVLIVAMGWHAYLVPMILSYLLLTVGATVLLRNRTGQALDGPVPDRREIAGYVGLASIGGLASFGFLQALPVVAARFTSSTGVAQFVAAVTLVGPLYFLPRALGMALFPFLAHAHGAGELDEVRRHTDLTSRALLVLLAPAFAAAILVSREILVVFGGGRYAGGVSVLQLLLVAVCVSVTQVPAVNALSSGTARDVRIPVTSAVVGCATGLVTVVPLGHFFGGTGVSVAYLLAVLAMQGPLVTVWRRYRMPWGGPLLRSVAVVGGALAVGRVIDAVSPAGTTRVLVDLGAALVLAAASLALSARDIRAMLLSPRGRRAAAGPPAHVLE